MKREIDCLLIGNNQVKFSRYEASVREMGKNSGAYNDLDKNFLRYNGENYSAADIFNIFCSSDERSGGSIHPIKEVESFNAAAAYLGTYLHRRGMTFAYVNSFQDEKEKLAGILTRDDVLTIGIITTLYVTIMPILEIMEFIRARNKTAKIIVGGPFPATKIRMLEPGELEYLFKSIGADFYINSSQGEAALVKIIRHLKECLPCDRVENIHYRAKGEYISTPLSRENNPLDENMVDWDLFPEVGEFVNIRTCISCMFSCAFCGFPQHAGKYQAAAVEKVEEELNLLAKKDSVKSIHFVDDTFNVPLPRFKAILRMMIAKGYQFKWNSFLRCQYLDREAVELMKESGCESVLLGLESGNDQILTNMNKKVKVEAYYRGIALLNEYDIVAIGNFVVGFPGETVDTARDTIRFIKASGLDFYRAQLWYCEPITPIYRQGKKYNLEGESFEWSHNTMNAQEASGLIDEMILGIEKPTRFPQYYFDYDTIVQLTHKGIKREQVDKFLQAFNNGIREKISVPGRKEMSFKVIEQVKNSCLSGSSSSASPGEEKEVEIINEEIPEFDF